MAESEELLHQEDVQQRLREMQELLARHRLVEGLVHRQEMAKHDIVENLVHKQHTVELSRKLTDMHPADIAYVLEALPLVDRLLVWDLLESERCLLYTSPSPRDRTRSRMPSSA